MLKIVPSEHWEIIREYLDEPGVVLLPEDVLDTMFSEKEQKVLRDEANGLTNCLNEYTFGGEPTVELDVIYNRESYAAVAILGENVDDEE